MGNGAAVSPGVVVPPPAIYALGFVVGVALEAAVPTPQLPLPAAVAVGGVGVLAWALLDGAAMREFRRAGTTVAPRSLASTLVTGGPYRRTRNPMYVGMAVLHAALAVGFGVLWALATLVAVLVVVDRAIVPREERALHATFGDAYAQYSAQVRRWI